MEPAAQPSRGSTVFAVLLLLLALVPIVLWPTETCWCIDEPRLIANAYHSNGAGLLSISGLYGNFGLPYSPVPTQIYQAILAISHDPASIVILRALLCSLVTGGCLLWMARTLGLPQWFAAAFLFAPYVSQQMRVLWDASFTIPIGMLALASLASFLRYEGKWSLRLALAAAFQVLVIHPQSIPLAFPIIGCLVWKYRPALGRDERGLFFTAAVLLAFHAKYFCVALGAFAWRLSHGGPVTSYPGGGTHLESAKASLLGGNIFTGYHAVPVGAPAYFEHAARFSQIIYVLIWIGLVATAVSAYRAVQAWRRKEKPAPLEVVSAVALAGFFTQTALFGVLRIPAGPQYFFGTFALHAFYAWMGVAALAQLGRLASRDLRFSGKPYGSAFRLVGLLPGASYLVVVAFLTVGSTLYNHAHAEDQPIWPTIKMTCSIVDQLNQFDHLGAYSDIDYLKTNNIDINYKDRPQAIRTLRLLLRPDPAKLRKPVGDLFITFHKVNGKPTGVVEVLDLAGQPPPKDAYYFDTSPLPFDWVPDPSTWQK